MPEDTWYLQKNASAPEEGMLTCTVMVEPAGTSLSMPRLVTLKLCKAVPTFVTVTERVSPAEAMTQVGEKKKSSAARVAVEPEAVAVPWSFTVPVSPAWAPQPPVVAGGAAD